MMFTNPNIPLSEEQQFDMLGEVSMGEFDRNSFDNIFNADFTNLTPENLRPLDENEMAMLNRAIQNDPELPLLIDASFRTYQRYRMLTAGQGDDLPPALVHDYILRKIINGSNLIPIEKNQVIQNNELQPYSINRTSKGRIISYEDMDKNETKYLQVELINEIYSKEQINHIFDIEFEELQLQLQNAEGIMNENAALQAELDRLRNELIDMQNLLDASREINDNLSKESQRNQKALDEANQALEELADAMQQEQEELKDQVEEAQNGAAKQLQDMVDKLTAEIDKLEEELDKKTKELNDELDKKTEELNDRIDINEDDINELEKEIATLNERIKNTKDELSETIKSSGRDYERLTDAFLEATKKAASQGSSTGRADVGLNTGQQQNNLTSTDNDNKETNDRFTQNYIINNKSFRFNLDSYYPDSTLLNSLQNNVKRIDTLTISNLEFPADKNTLRDLISSVENQKSNIKSRRDKLTDVMEQRPESQSKQKDKDKFNVNQMLGMEEAIDTVISLAKRKLERRPTFNDIPISAGGNVGNGGSVLNFISGLNNGATGTQFTGAGGGEIIDNNTKKTTGNRQSVTSSLRDPKAKDPNDKGIRFI